MTAVGSGIKIKYAMDEKSEPFTGTWKFSAERSNLSTPVPDRWVQEIVTTHDEIVVREYSVWKDGTISMVRVWARFDGSDYPITGLPVADFMAYTRVNSHSISGTGKKNGVVSVTETITVAPDGGSLTLVYSIQTGASQVHRGIAVFEREAVR